MTIFLGHSFSDLLARGDRLSLEEFLCYYFVFLCLLAVLGWRLPP